MRRATAWRSVSRRGWHAALPLALAILVAPPGWSAARPEPYARPDAHSGNQPVLVVSTGPREVVLDLSMPRLASADMLRPALAPAAPALGGLTRAAPPGHPKLPYTTTLLGAPPAAEVTTRVVADDAVTLPGTVALPPAPGLAPPANGVTVDPEHLDDPAALASAGAAPDGRATPDQAVYGGHRPYPPAPVRITGDGWLRDQRVVAVALYPFEYDVLRRTVRQHLRLRVIVRFEDPRASIDSDHPAGPLNPSWPDPFDSVLRASLANYREARAWRSRPPAPTGASAAAVDPAAGAGLSSVDQGGGAAETFRLVVADDGLYRVTRADFEAAGVPLGAADPRTFRMTNQGRPVAIQVGGEADGRFDGDDAIVFYGRRYRETLPPATLTTQTAGTVTLVDPGREAKYGDDNVYWLAAGGEPGPRMAARDGEPSGDVPLVDRVPDTVHAEASSWWWTNHWTSQDVWFWDQINAANVAAVTRTYAVALPSPAAGDAPIRVRGEIVAAKSAPGAAADHHARFAFNDHVIADARWEGRARYRFAGEAPGASIRPDGNALRIEVVGDGEVEADSMYFDWFEVDYVRRLAAEGDRLSFGAPGPGPRRYALDGFGAADSADPADLADPAVFDVTEPAAPVRIVNARVSTAGAGRRLEFQTAAATAGRFEAAGAGGFRAPKSIARARPSSLRESNQGADYLIITAPEFRDAIQPLADHRAAEGMRVRVVDVGEVYDAFGDGIFNPRAIRAFLAYAYASWEPPAPAYALLVGGGHWNFRGHNVGRYGQGGVLRRVYMPPNLAWVDPVQGEVDSANLLATVSGDDPLPDLAIGRLVVYTAAQAEAAVAKILAYERSAPGDWGRRHMFVADNPDNGGDFERLSENVIRGELPPGAAADRFYLSDFQGRDIRDAIVAHLNITGSLLVNYVGHGHVEGWAGEDIFNVGTIPKLRNGDRLPVVLSWTCLDGYWCEPRRTSLAEALVSHPGAGAVGTFSPTGLGVATGHHIVQKGVYRAVFQGEVARLGPATVAGKLALWATGTNEDLVHTYTVFGDPALRLRVPPAGVEPTATPRPATPDPTPAAGTYLPAIYREW